MRACKTPSSVSSIRPSLSVSRRPEGYTLLTSMKSARVLRPGSGLNLQATPNGLLKAMSMRARSGQRPLDQIRRHSCAWHSVGRAAASPFADISNRRALLEPFAYVEIKSDAVHVVVHRFLERHTKHIVVDAGDVREIDIVVGECGPERRSQRHAVQFRMFGDRRVHGAGEAMEETRLYAVGREQLANIFQGVDGVLRGLSGKSVHQIGVYEDSRVGEGACYPGHLFDRHSLLHEFEQAIRCHFQ